MIQVIFPIRKSERWLAPADYHKLRFPDLRMLLPPQVSVKVCGHKSRLPYCE